jgi:hypothetical protein
MEAQNASPIEKPSDPSSDQSIPIDLLRIQAMRCATKAIEAATIKMAFSKC